MARDLDELFRDFRDRPHGQGPYTFRRLRRVDDEGPRGQAGRQDPVVVATGINADRFRDIPGVATSTAESATAGTPSSRTS